MACPRCQHDWPMIGQAFALFRAVLGTRDRAFSVIKPIFIAENEVHKAGACARAGAYFGSRDLALAWSLLG